MTEEAPAAPPTHVNRPDWLVAENWAPMYTSVLDGMSFYVYAFQQSICFFKLSPNSKVSFFCSPLWMWEKDIIFFM